MTAQNYHERNHWTGTAAEMAACVPVNPGAIWFIDSGPGVGDSYWWNGASWSPIGGGGVGPPTEGPGIDIIGTQVGLGGDTVELYDNSGLPVAEFATVTLALAAAASGNMVYVPSGTFAEDITIPAGVTLTCRGNNSKIVGAVLLAGLDSHIKGIIIELIGSDAGDLIGITGPASDIGQVNDCSITVINNGAGGAQLVQMNDGDLFIKNSYGTCTTNGGGDAIGILVPVDKEGDCDSNNNYIYATASAGGDGWAFVSRGLGNIYVTDGMAVGSTAPVGV